MNFTSVSIHFFLFVFFIAILCITSSCQAAAATTTTTTTTIPDDDCLVCHFLRADIALEKNEDNDDDDHYLHTTSSTDQATIQCWTQLPGKSYREPFQVSSDEFLNEQQTEQLESVGIAFSSSCIPKTSFDLTTRRIILHQDNLTLNRLRHRHAQQQQQEEQEEEEGIMDYYDEFIQKPEWRRQRRFGVKRLLAVRIVATTTMTSSNLEEEEEEEVPDETLDQIQGAIFGTGPNPDNIVTSVADQYKAVSHGQLQFVPALGNGVLEITLDNFRVAGSSVQDELIPKILQATHQTLIGEHEDEDGNIDKKDLALHDIADYIIYCLPSGSLFDEIESTWKAFTYLYEPYSYYQGGRCTKLSVVMHELGHGLGFQHSGLTGDDMYGDETGYMGFSNNQFNTPRKAFNAHKHSISQWFQDRAITITQSMMQQQGEFQIKLTSFVDYQPKNSKDHDDSSSLTTTTTATTTTTPVLIQVGSDLHIQYNRAKDYNIETDATAANKVTLVQGQNEFSVSHVVANLDKGEQYTYNQDITITVCSMETTTSSSGDDGTDYVVLSIHLEDGVHQSTCGRSILPKMPAVRTVSSPNQNDNENEDDEQQVSSTTTTTTMPPPPPGEKSTLNILIEEHNDDDEAMNGNDDNNNNDDKDSLVLYIGIVVGVAVLLLLCVILYHCIHHTKAIPTSKNNHKLDTTVSKKKTNNNNKKINHRTMERQSTVACDELGE